MSVLVNSGSGASFTVHPMHSFLKTHPLSHLIPRCFDELCSVSFRGVFAEGAGRLLETERES
jgi:hypothetical protein